MYKPTDPNISVIMDGALSFRTNKDGVLEGLEEYPSLAKSLLRRGEIELVRPSGKKKSKVEEKNVEGKSKTAGILDDFLMPDD